MRKPKRVDWDPKPDITAYELACAMPALIHAAHSSWWMFTDDWIDGLDAEVKRHFRVRIVN